MGYGLPFVAFNFLFLGVPPGVDSRVRIGVLLNLILCHMEVPVVCSLHPPSLPKQNVSLSKINLI